MLYEDVDEWRRTLDTAYQPDYGDCIVDCDVSSDSTTLTPQRPSVRLACPDAPKKRKRIICTHSETQTDLSLGTQRVKGATLQLYSIDYSCHSCHVLQFSNKNCRFCGEPVQQRNFGNQVGLYHLVPYFE